MGKRRWYDATFVKIEAVSKTTKRFWIKITGEDILEYQVGQFITMDLPIHEKRLKRWRSYSIANRPDNSNLLEFCIVYLEGGLASNYLFKEVTVGTTVKLKGPGGIFTLPNTIDKDLVFICTGTGIAPFRAMIQNLLITKEVLPAIHLIFGTRYQENILYKTEWEELAANQPQFKYDIALSKDNIPNTYKGYVHQIYETKYQATDNVLFYLCGWSNMVDEAKERLLNKGFEEAQIICELYG